MSQKHVALPKEQKKHLKFSLQNQPGSEGRYFLDITNMKLCPMDRNIYWVLLMCRNYANPFTSINTFKLSSPFHTRGTQSSAACWGVPASQWQSEDLKPGRLALESSLLITTLPTVLFHPTNVTLMRKQVFPQFPFDLCLLHQEPIKQLIFFFFTFIKMSSLRVTGNLKLKASN